MPRKVSSKKTDKKESRKPVVSLKNRPKKNTKVDSAHSIAGNKSFANYVPQRLRAVTRKQWVVIGIVVIFLIVLYGLQNYLIVARVNGSPISRWQLVNELEKQQGKQVLDQLVTQTLIEQEAAKQHVVVTNADVNNELKKVQTQVAQSGQTLDQALASQGMSLQELKDNIRLQLLAEKMATKNVTVSNKEVADYISKNKSSLPTDVSAAQQTEQVRQTLLQQKQQAALQTWVQNLRSKASIDYIDKTLSPQG